MDAPTSDRTDLGWSLGVLLRGYQVALGSALDSLPHGFRGFQVLHAVDGGAHPSQLALAAHLGIDRTVMTYLIDDLVADGLVERRPNPQDRRQRQVVLTPTGTQRLAECEAVVGQAEDHALAGLDPQERAALCGLLRRAAQGARDMGVDRDPCRVVQDAVAGLS
ncbi:MarR family winged helix-turn-helix transcriptional regulator [Cellulomonas sp. NPDC089187]|uniref:MarR family winged helix-turn-helix transcriptional regulator n=1 Tax=Cellulomonas sp. NPDC089187 TaxID=3154970 RepID=UPI0034459301